MRRILKFVGVALAGAVSLIMITFIIFSLRVELIRNSTVDVSVQPIPIPTDEDSIAEGKRLVQMKGCWDCHDSDLGGRTFINEPPVGRYSGSNLTPGQGSVTTNYTDADWIRSIRYGIAPNGRPLIAMPSDEFQNLSNEDLGRMIAYLKTLAPVDRETVPISIGPLARVLFNLNQLPLLFPYLNVNMEASAVESVAVGATAEYGKYLATACTGCHGHGFSGGPIPGTPPSWPAAANITPSGRIANWTFEDFKKVLTEGITPDGHQIDLLYMPWKATQAMTDVEIEALFLFLKQLPPRTAGTR